MKLMMRFDFYYTALYAHTHFHASHLPALHFLILHPVHTVAGTEAVGCESYSKFYEASKVPFITRRRSARKLLLYTP